MLGEGHWQEKQQAQEALIVSHKPKLISPELLITVRDAQHLLSSLILWTFQEDLTQMPLDNLQHLLQGSQ